MLVVETKSPVDEKWSRTEIYESEFNNMYIDLEVSCSIGCRQFTVTVGESYNLLRDNIFS
jgi:hypothetical protein